jgi:processive 1,2-diacylglycerol beta-glucosyltransferase
VHSYWFSDEVDLYLVAYQKTKEQLLNLGAEEKKIRVLGIPVDTKFSQGIDRNSVCEKFNLKPNKFSVLVVTGAFGFASIEKIAGILRNDTQLLIVCGNNKKIFRRLSQSPGENIKVFGFVRNMHELMSAADIIITKPGGLTISEALVKNLPMIFISPIPGQETNNAEFMQQMGLGLIAKDIFQVRDLVMRFKNDSGLLNEFKRRIKDSARLNAVKDVIKFLE